MTTAIAVIEHEGLYKPDLKAEQLQQLFATKSIMDDVVASIHTLALAQPGAKDPTLLIQSGKGRAAIKSAAAMVTRSKTFLDDMGKQVVADLKSLPKLIDENRKGMRDDLDTLAAAIRQPLTDWENKSKELSERLNRMDMMPTTLANASADEVEIQLDLLHEAPLGEKEWNGMFAEAQDIYKRVEPTLVSMLARKRKEEADASELARLRSESEARTKLDEDAARIKSAAEKESQAALGREAEAKRQAEVNAERANAAQKEITQLRSQIAAHKSTDTVTDTLRAVSSPAVNAVTTVTTLVNADLRKAFNREAAAAIEAILNAPPTKYTKAQDIVLAIKNGLIPHVTITY